MRCGSVLFAVICLLCVFTAIFAFISGVFYFSIVEIFFDKKHCSKVDLEIGRSCSTKVQLLTNEIDKIIESNRMKSEGTFRALANLCNNTLNCVRTMNCMKWTDDFEVVQISCEILNFISHDFHNCFNILINRIHKNNITCLQEYLTERTSVCDGIQLSDDCMIQEIRENCEKMYLDMFRKHKCHIRKLLEC